MEHKLIKSGRKVKRAVYDPATDTTRSDAKGRIRSRIQEEVLADDTYDLFDLIADLSKRCNILERGFFLLLKDMKDGSTLPATLTGYNDSIEYYIAQLGTGDYKARTDLAADIAVLHQELMRRDNKVTEILEAEGY